MVRGDTIVTVFFSFRGCPVCCVRAWGSKVARAGEGSKAGDVLDRKREGDGLRIGSAGLDGVGVPAPGRAAPGVGGNRVKAGDLAGCGDVALLGLINSASSESSFWSLMFFNFSNVACRRAKSDEEDPGALRRPLNMTLYLSRCMSGISTSSINDGPFSPESAAVLAESAIESLSLESGFDLITIGLCFGVFLSIIVFALVGVLVGAPACPKAGIDMVEVVITDTVALSRGFSGCGSGISGPECFLLPNKPPNSFLLWVFDR
jgi:hypothetical protein